MCWCNTRGKQSTSALQTVLRTQSRSKPANGNGFVSYSSRLLFINYLDTSPRTNNLPLPPNVIFILATSTPVRNYTVRQSGPTFCGVLLLPYHPTGTSPVSIVKIAILLATCLFYRLKYLPSCERAWQTTRLDGIGRPCTRSRHPLSTTSQRGQLGVIGDWGSVVQPYLYLRATQLGPLKQNNSPPRPP